MNTTLNLILRALDDMGATYLIEHGGKMHKGTGQPFIQTLVGPSRFPRAASVLADCATTSRTPQRSAGGPAAARSGLSPWAVVMAARVGCSCSG